MIYSSCPTAPFHCTCLCLGRNYVTPISVLHWTVNIFPSPLYTIVYVYLVYACLQSACWFCSHLPKCSCKGKCHTQDAALVVWHCRLCKHGNPNYSHL